MILAHLPNQAGDQIEKTGGAEQEKTERSPHQNLKPAEKTQEDVVELKVFDEQVLDRDIQEVLSSLHTLKGVLMGDWQPAGQVLSHLFAGDSSGPPPIPGSAGSGSGGDPGGLPHAHKIDFELFGDDMQIVEVELDPGETVIAEAGAMNYLEEDISFEAKMGDGSKPNEGIMGALLNVGKRVLTGESIFLTHFTHMGGQGKRRVAFAAPYPGKIMAVNLGETGGEITCQKDAFLCASMGTQVTIAFNKRLGAGFFGGEGFILQKLRGDGLVFMHAGAPSLSESFMVKRFVSIPGVSSHFHRGLPTISNVQET